MIDPIRTRIRVEQLDGTRPFVQLRIADVRNVVGLVGRDPTAGFYQGDRLPDDFFRLRHIDQHQPRGRDIESCPRQTGCTRVTLDDLDVTQAILGHHGLSECDGVRTSLHPNDSAGRTHPCGKKVEAPLWSATDIDNPVARPDGELVE
jgi:hypothetical protein